MYRCIENVPHEYISIIKNARKKPFPYQVRFDGLLPHTFFLNYEGSQDIRSIRPGNKPSDPTVMDIRQLKYTPDGTIFYKLTHDVNDEFQELPAMRRLGKPTYPEYKQLYPAPRPITYRKWQHLQELKCTIPSFFHSYYDDLPHIGGEQTPGEQTPAVAADDADAANDDVVTTVTRVKSGGKGKKGGGGRGKVKGENVYGGRAGVKGKKGDGGSCGEKSGAKGKKGGRGGVKRKVKEDKEDVVEDVVAAKAKKCKRK